MTDLFNYSRREASEVNIGATPMGGANPIRIQSMTNTITMDTDACIDTGCTRSRKPEKYKYRITFTRL